MAQFYSRSPPPLQHPVPTHPAFIPEPPSTPASPQGYQRYTSSPPVPSQHHQQSFHQPQAYTHPAFQHSQPIPPQQQHLNGGVPDFAAWGLDGATAQFGMQLGQNAMTAGQEYMQKNLGGLVPITHLKQHFNVSNSYVVHKLRLVLFPWRHRPWTRKLSRNEQGATEFLSPREDLNSPDLYIPMMAFVTYILLVGVQSGLQQRFHPEILGITGSKAVFVLLVDFLFVKGGCYLLGVQTSSPMVDLLAYGGYKFVGVIATLLMGLLTTSTTLYTLVFFYVFFANAFFLVGDANLPPPRYGAYPSFSYTTASQRRVLRFALDTLACLQLRSLRSVVLPDPAGAPASAGTVSQAQRSRRITFLFLVAVAQIAWMTILVRV
ncbi:YIF1-domain-containing protein [Amylostereum chailletii]|nr:YIF1-domain-containing protein [Amylostereum chailletii]